MSAKSTLRTLTLPRNMMAKKEATVEFKGKIKSSYYLDIKIEERIMALYMKRLKEGQRVRKSQSLMKLLNYSTTKIWARNSDGFANTILNV